ncbi:MAG: nucleotidyltransferase family protein [Bacillota bacterium]|nr:nucleotidyltransferase family protein [Bacillota bacterium]
MLDCIILAGGVNADLEKLEGTPNKALIKIEDKEMVRYVLETYRQVEDIERIVLVGPVEDFAFVEKEFSVELVPETGSILENLSAASRFLNTQKPVLISTADIPLISPLAVRDFLEKCLPFDFDFYYPIVGREKCEESFPRVKRTYVNLKEGVFTGGNIFVVKPEKIEPTVPRLRLFIENRKNPVKMASLLGTGFLIRLMAKKLNISQLESRFSSLLDLNSKAIISDYPEIGFDLDKPSDLELIRKFMGQKSHGERQD